MLGNIIILIIAFLLGGSIATILSLGTWTKKLAKSNIMGDSAGGFDEFSDRIDFYHRRDNVALSDQAQFIRYYGREILREKGIEAPDMSFIDEGFPDDEDIPDVDIPLFKPLQ